MAKKDAGPQLYQTYLDIFYSNQFTKDCLHDIEIERKLLMKHKKTTDALLKKCAEQYEKIYGKKLTPPSN